METFDNPELDSSKLYMAQQRGMSIIALELYKSDVRAKTTSELAVTHAFRVEQKTKCIKSY